VYSPRAHHQDDKRLQIKGVTRTSCWVSRRSFG
jgi:hypothetical protein